MDVIRRRERMRRGVMALRHQFAQGGNGVFSDVLAGERAFGVGERAFGVRSCIAAFSSSAIRDGAQFSVPVTISNPRSRKQRHQAAA